MELVENPAFIARAGFCTLCLFSALAAQAHERDVCVACAWHRHVTLRKGQAPGNHLQWSSLKAAPLRKSQLVR